MSLNRSERWKIKQWPNVCSRKQNLYPGIDRLSTAAFSSCFDRLFHFTLTERYHTYSCFLAQKINLMVVVNERWSLSPDITVIKEQNASIHKQQTYRVNYGMYTIVTFRQTEQHSSFGWMLLSLGNVTYLLDVTPSNPLPHPLSPPIPLCVIKVQSLVAKQHQRTADTKKVYMLRVSRCKVLIRVLYEIF